ncbi:hypothetical protein PHISP_03701 [Aspergillus sp. HF37]|nr:hypothetical protein PHISP_03701 [Aspergillus sp. HF37]
MDEGCERQDMLTNAGNAITVQYANKYVDRRVISRLSLASPQHMEALKQLHSSVTEAFEASLENACNQLCAEIALRNAKAKAAEDKAAAENKEHLRTAARVGVLEHEVVFLREALSERQMDPKEAEASTTKSEGMREAYAPERILKLWDRHGVDSSHPDSLEVKKIVDTKYRALYGEVQTLIKVSGELRTQIKRHKKKLIRWHNCMDRDVFTLVLDGVPVKFQKVQANGDQMPPRTSKPGPFFIESLDAAGDTTTVDASSTNWGLPRPTPQANSERPKTSSQNVRGPYDEMSQLHSTMSDQSGDKETGSSDTARPDTRPPKRKRESLSHPHSMRPPHNPEDNNRAPPIVKSETLSSSPLGSMAQSRGQIPPGTQDLDEVGDTVETPTKRRNHNPSQNHQIVQPPALWPTSTAEGNLSTTNGPNRRSKKDDRKLERVVRHGLPSVAEDGDDDHSKIESRRRQQGRSGQLSSSTNHTPVQGRLQSLLESPMASRSPLSMQGRFQNPGRNPIQHLDGSIDHGSAAARSSPASRPWLSMGGHDAQMHVANGNGPNPDRLDDTLPVESPDNEPYRARPLHRLELSHFKINPNYNQGLDFAFDTVMRKKDERQCAPGCMRPDCCGEKFHSMARLGGVPAELRRSYQGNTSNHEAHLNERRVPGMLDEEDGARALANCYAKHRHHHQRPRSPPGFWRADMPSTQDLERDREEARKYEREKVKERHREAMRPGGLWMYVDE